MRTVTTNSGFTAELDETRLNDMELFDALTELDDGNMGVLPVVVKKILGGSKKALYDHVRASDGTVPIEKVTEELREIVLALGGKNC